MRWGGQLDGDSAPKRISISSAKPESYCRRSTRPPGAMAQSEAGQGEAAEPTENPGSAPCTLSCRPGVEDLSGPACKIFDVAGKARGRHSMPGAAQQDGGFGDDDQGAGRISGHAADFALHQMTQ